ncbi:MAG TPA: tRNA lysidine(34) synthetase TilS [Saprospiraceae bacterium]|nr:tRNA lysidine(34) synthetase TilS [Saprospiraceae bacterium]
MQERFLSYIKQENLFGLEDKLLCAVSGGIDSMVLLHLLTHHHFNIGVAHINHHKRGKESDLDEVLVSAYCKEHGLPFYQYSLPIPEKKGNFQKYARTQRYEWLRTVAKENNYRYILTAHHLDDVLETMLMNQMRGSGLHGLLSLKAKNLDIRRPLLCFDKQEIVDYARLYNVPYREDSSNLQNDYERNKVRNLLIPLMHQVEERSVKGLYHSLEILRKEATILDKLKQEWKSKYSLETSASTTINLKDLKLESQHDYILYSVLFDFGFNSTQCEEMLNSIQIGAFWKSENYMAVMKDGQLTLHSSSHVEKINQQIPLDGRYIIDNKILDIRLLDKKENLESDGSIYVAFDRFPFPLKIRNKEDGDSFRPSGMQGKSQSLKKFMNGLKLDRIEKTQILLLCNDKEICAVIPYRVSENYLVNEKREFVLKIKLSFMSS